MLALNFSHPFSPDILAQLEQAVGEPVSVRNIRTQFDPAQPFAPQVDALLSDLGDLPDQFIINPPAPVRAAPAAGRSGSCLAIGGDHSLI